MAAPAASSSTVSCMEPRLASCGEGGCQASASPREGGAAVLVGQLPGLDSEEFREGGAEAEAELWRCRSEAAGERGGEAAAVLCELALELRAKDPDRKAEDEAEAELAQSSQPAPLPASAAEPPPLELLSSPLLACDKGRDGPAAAAAAAAALATPDADAERACAKLISRTSWSSGR
jgi:hypothetical protein